MSRFGKSQGRTTYIVDTGADAVDFTRKRDAVSAAKELRRRAGACAVVVRHPVKGRATTVYQACTKRRR